MNICLVRHAIAVERGSADNVDDRARPLTPTGRKRMKEAAVGLARLVTPTRLYSSPLLRACQTAEILASEWGLPIAAMEALGTGAHQAVLDQLNATPVEDVVLVGHEPWMSELLSLLLTGEPMVMHTEFKKGQAALVACGVQVRPGSCTLEWLIPPAALRRMR
jgi:phosphohistidine phosphatase